MAAITNANTATTFADATLTEVINRAVRMQPRTPYLYAFLAFIPPLLANTKRYSDNTYALASASAAYTETDEVPSFELTPTAVDVDTALYAKGAVIGDWGSTLNVHQAAALVAAEVHEAIELRFETDVLALASSLTNTTGSASTVMTIDNFVAVTAAYRSLAKASTTPPLMVLSEAARAALQADVMKAGGSIYASVIGPQLAGVVSGTNQGEWGAFGGYMIASTDRMPVGDTTGKRNIIVSAPDASTGAIVLPFSRAPTYETARATAAGRLGTWVIGSHAHGAGIAMQARGYNFTTAA